MNMTKRRQVLEHDRKWHLDNMEGGVERVAQAVNSTYELPLWHLYHEPHMKLTTDYYFLYLLLPRPIDLPKTSQYTSSHILGPATPWRFTKQTHCWAYMGPPAVNHLFLSMSAQLLTPVPCAQTSSAMKFYPALNLKGDQSQRSFPWSWFLHAFINSLV